MREGVEGEFGSGEQLRGDVRVANSKQHSQALNLNNYIQISYRSLQISYYPPNLIPSHSIITYSKLYIHHHHNFSFPILGLGFDLSLLPILSWNFLKNCPLWEYLVVFPFLLFSIFFLASASTLLIPPYSMILFILLPSCSFLLCLFILLVFRCWDPSSFRDLRLIWESFQAMDWFWVAVMGIFSSRRMQGQELTLVSRMGLGMKLKLLSLSSLQFSSLNRLRIYFFSLSSLLFFIPRLLAKSISYNSPRLCLLFSTDISGRLVKCSLNPGAISILTLSSNMSSRILLLINSSSMEFQVGLPCCQNLSPRMNSIGFQTRLFTGRCLEEIYPFHRQSLRLRSLFSSLLISSRSYSFFWFSCYWFSPSISRKWSKFQSSNSSSSPSTFISLEPMSFLKFSSSGSSSQSS